MLMLRERTHHSTAAAAELGHIEPGTPCASVLFIILVHVPVPVNCTMSFADAFVLQQVWPVICFLIFLHDVEYDGAWRYVVLALLIGRINFSTELHGNIEIIFLRLAPVHVDWHAIQLSLCDAWHTLRAPNTLAILT